MLQRLNTSKHKVCFPSRPSQQVALLIVAVMIWLLSGIQAHAADKAFDEYQVKAVFLYRLTLFITWPEGVFPKPDEALVIGIIGDDPFGEHIDRVVKNEKFKGKPIRIQRYRSIEDVKKAPSHVLFINRALKQQWPQLKKAIEAYPMLTVSDMEAFGQLGGMINIRTHTSRIKIEINPDETRMAGLKISSKLLKVSRNVATSPKGDLR